jgi:hypothetical protein
MNTVKYLIVVFIFIMFFRLLIEYFTKPMDFISILFGIFTVAISGTVKGIMFKNKKP